MKPGKYRIDEPAFIFSAGDEFRLEEGSLKSDICDVCGLPKRCDWLTYLGEGCKTGFDCCRSCQRKILKEVKD